ncbi:hypothetical protein BJ165DRAFT_349227 [Panaeolus papilionaceus]|nr:hypothetical protein BJ165DRAFT_349227 [Panaeolus papilionaceus]
MALDPNNSAMLHHTTIFLAIINHISPMRRHIAKETKEIAITLSRSGMTDREIDAHLGIKPRTMRRLRALVHNTDDDDAFLGIGCVELCGSGDVLLWKALIIRLGWGFGGEQRPSFIFLFLSLSKKKKKRHDAIFTKWFYFILFYIRRWSRSPRSLDVGR